MLVVIVWLDNQPQLISIEVRHQQATQRLSCDYTCTCSLCSLSSLLDSRMSVQCSICWLHYCLTAECIAGLLNNNLSFWLYTRSCVWGFHMFRVSSRKSWSAQSSTTLHFGCFVCTRTSLTLERKSITVVLSHTRLSVRYCSYSSTPCLCLDVSFNILRHLERVALQNAF